MLFLALHFSGMDKILNKGNLEGGLYDLALVEKFAPLDKQARIYQEWARLYVIGASFWGVFPDKSVYYFSQLANAAPYLKDLSGIYAIDRYRLALIQYGDQLSKTEEWCLAVEQYDLAFTLGEDQGLLPTATYVADLCQFGTTTPTIENLDPTSTLSLFSPTPGAFLTSTPIPTTPTVTMDVTLTPTLGSTPTPTIEPETPMPTPTESPYPPPQHQHLHRKHPHRISRYETIPNNEHKAQFKSNPSEFIGWAPSPSPLYVRHSLPGGKPDGRR